MICDTRTLGSSKKVWLLTFAFFLLIGVFYYWPFLSSHVLGPRVWDWSWQALYVEHLAWGLRHFGEVPKFAPPVVQTTNLFFANGELPNFSPIYILAPWVSPEFLIKGNFFLLWALGVAGYVVLAHRQKWSLATTWILFPVYFLSGFLAARLFIGHQGFFSLILFPWVFVFLLNSLQREKFSIPALFQDALGIAAALWLMLNTGGTHVMIWILYPCMLFAVLYTICFPKTYQSVLALGLGGFLFGGLSAFKLLPMLAEYHGYNPPSLHGFLSAHEFISAFVDYHRPWTQGRHFSGDYHSVEWWEMYAYVGWPFVILTVASIITLLGLRSERRRALPLVATLLIVLALTYGEIYFAVRKIPFPGLGSQRHTTRFVVVALILAVLLVARLLRLVSEYFNRSQRASAIWHAAALVLLIVSSAHYRHANAQWLRFSGEDKLGYGELPALQEKNYLTAEIIAPNGKPLSKQEYSIEAARIRVFPETPLAGSYLFKDLKSAHVPDNLSTNTSFALSTSTTDGTRIEASEAVKEFDLVYSNRLYGIGKIISILFGIAAVAGLWRSLRLR